MPQLQIHAASDGRYWIDVMIHGNALRCFVDTGLTDTHDQIGLELEPTQFDLLHRGGAIQATQHRFRRDSAGTRTKVLVRDVDASLIDPAALTPIGPTVHVTAVRGAIGLPSRAGVVFPHKLIGDQVTWDLSARTWIMDIP